MSRRALLIERIQAFICEKSAEDLDGEVHEPQGL